MSIEVDEKVWSNYQNLLFKLMKFAGKQLIFTSKITNVPPEITQEYDILNKEVIEFCFPSSSKLQNNLIQSPTNQNAIKAVEIPQETNNNVEANFNVTVETVNNNGPEIFMKKAVHKPTAKVKRLYSNDSFVCTNCSKAFKLHGDLKIHGMVCTQKRTRKMSKVPENEGRAFECQVKVEKNMDGIFQRERVTVEEIEHFLKKSSSAS